MTKLFEFEKPCAVLNPVDLTGISDLRRSVLEPMLQVERRFGSTSYVGAREAIIAALHVREELLPPPGVGFMEHLFAKGWSNYHLMANINIEDLTGCGITNRVLTHTASGLSEPLARAIVEADLDLRFIRLDLYQRVDGLVDPSYWPIGDFTVRALLKGGIKPRDLVSWCYDGMDTTNISAKDIRFIIDKAIEIQDGMAEWDEDDVEGDIAESVWAIEDGLTHLMDARQDTTSIASWSHYINSRPVLEWVGRNVHHLVKDHNVKVSHEGVETTVLVPMHRVIDFMSEAVSEDKGYVPARLRDELKKWEEKFQSEALDIMTSDEALPIAPFDLGDEYVQLDHSKKLIEEGRAMNHCAGGYVEVCRSGDTFVYHVGAPAPEGVTVEVSHDGDVWRCVQAMKKDNIPCPDTMARTRTLLADLT